MKKLSLIAASLVLLTSISFAKQDNKPAPAPKQAPQTAPVKKTMTSKHVKKDAAPAQTNTSTNTDKK